MDAFKRTVQNSGIPQRMLLSFMGFLAIVNAYNMRLCLDVALTRIVDSNGSTLHGYNCSQPEYGKQLPQIPFGMQEQPKHLPEEWPQHLQTLILIAFYLGYVLSNIPGGLLAEKYGGKRVLVVGVAITGILTILTPTAIRLGGAYALIFTRILIGLSEGPTYPALSAMLAHWIPAQERGTLAVFVLSGSQIGKFIVNVTSNVLLERYEYSVLFYFFGSCALIWCLFFIILCYDEPVANPYIMPMELEYLQNNIKTGKSQPVLPSTPWIEIFKSAPVWALISSTIQYDWNQLNMKPDVPKLMQDTKNLTFIQSLKRSITISVPYLFAWIVSLFSGVTSDILINRDILSATATRQLMSLISLLGPQLLSLFSSCLTCRQEENRYVNIFTCTAGLAGTYYAGVKLTPLDLSPNYAGTLMGIANGLGSLTNLVAPFCQECPLRKLPIRQIQSILGLVSAVLSSAEVQNFNEPINRIENPDVLKIENICAV